MDAPAWSSPDSHALDSLLHAFQARLTGSLSPASLTLAWLDWALHLANAPGRRMALAQAAAEGIQRLLSPDDWLAPAPQDKRFRDPAWSNPPFNYWAQGFLLAEDWWRQVTAPLPGVTKGHQQVVAFAARQLLDIFSPSNFIATNPEVLRASAAEGGGNFLRGAVNLRDDVQSVLEGKPLKDVEGFAVGKDVAVTPGKVVFRNALMELIQYSPTTAQVHPEPILIVPAWIMKYYILDLSPEDSFVRYLVGQGFTVFCISWKNPGQELRDIAFDDYRRLGVMAALDVMDDICGHAPVHAYGYCLGGTLLAIVAATMGRDKDSRFRTVTLIAAQTDFTEAGELQLFTDDSQLALLDDMMWRQGYLDSHQMTGAFQMLRSNDLVWSRLVRTYLLGRRNPASDLMAWNADTTRMPFRMHSEYLHHMFLNNDLAEGRYCVTGHPVAVSDIQAPLFVLGTEWDHVAPWRSVYKIHQLNPGDLTFVLASGGHNAGVISPPGHAGRHYRMAVRKPGDAYQTPNEWLAATGEEEGSWWGAYAGWLAVHSTAPIAPPGIGSEAYPALTSAPGVYVSES